MRAAVLVAALCGFGLVKGFETNVIWAEIALKGAGMFPRSRACVSPRMQNCFVSHGTADRRAVILRGVASVKALCSSGALVNQCTLRVLVLTPHSHAPQGLDVVLGTVNLNPKP